MDKYLVLVLGALSLILTVFSGFYAFRTKKIEFDIKRIEALRLENEKAVEAKHEIKEVERDKKDERRTAAQTKEILDRVAEVEMKLGKIEEIFLTHIGDSDFKLNFRNKVSNLAMNLLKASDLDDTYKSVLAFWFSNIEAFSLDFYYSDYRKKDKEALKRKLNENLEILLTNFNHHINMAVKEIRDYNGTNRLFSKYLEMTSFHGKARVLTLAFGENGFDVEGGNTRFVNLVLDHINSIHSDFLTTLRVWRKCKRGGFQLDGEDTA